MATMPKRGVRVASTRLSSNTAQEKGFAPRESETEQRDTWQNIVMGII